MIGSLRNEADTAGVEGVCTLVANADAAAAAAAIEVDVSWVRKSGEASMY